jgi:peptidoglycan/xylan/chitin deacetylase (PgdA/CDA1 family)
MDLQGSFFPPAKVTSENRVLDVNKIHFILASKAEKKAIISEIFSLMNTFRGEYSLRENSYYYKRFAREDRFDTTDVVFIKAMLQKELPEPLRRRIVQKLFERYVARDETRFARELYMDMEELKYLQRRGMYIGSHGYDHLWLNTLSEEEQRREIELSLEFLKRIGARTKDFIMAYPYGAYNDSLLALLEEYYCRMAFTTRVGLADLDRDHPLLLPRLDTNDLPKERDAKPNAWTLEILEQ